MDNIVAACNPDSAHSFSLVDLTSSAKLVKFLKEQCNSQYEIDDKDDDVPGYCWLLTRDHFLSTTLAGGEMAIYD